MTLDMIFAVVEVVGLVTTSGLNCVSVEQMNLVQGDLGSLSIIGHKIGVSGVGQRSILYIGQFLRAE